MENKKYICCCSGGKDSTVMFLQILKYKLPIDIVIISRIKEEYGFIKFNQDKIIKLCEQYKIKCIVLNGSFKDLLFNKYKRFPIFCCRWCTDLLKNKPIRKYLKENFGKKINYYQYIGFAYDELDRLKSTGFKINYSNGLFPLIDLKLTEADCYKIAQEYGFKYDTRFNRSGCWCCPLMNKHDITILINNYPQYWKIIKQWEQQLNIKWKYNSITKTGGTDYWEKRCKNNF